MSHDFNNTDTIPVPPPSEQAPPPAPDTSEIVEQRRHAALSQLAKDENVEAYAAQREDQAAAIDRGEVFLKSGQTNGIGARIKL